jgi:serine phosphatase RsbU (regulator of sigma subunit)
MRKKLLKFVVPVLSLLCLAGYLVWVNPLLVSSLNLLEFDRHELNRKPNDIASALLGDNEKLEINESISADLDLLNNLQRSIGLRSATQIISGKIPVQTYSVEFYPVKEKQLLALKNQEAVMALKIDVHGQVAEMDYKDPNSDREKPITAAEAGKKLMRLAPLLGLDPLSLQQIRPQDLENGDWIKADKATQEEKDKAKVLAEQEFYFSEKIDGVPLASYNHNFKFTKNEVHYSRSLFFKKAVFSEKKYGLADYVAVVIWLGIGFLVLTVFSLKVRRDEIDWSHFFRFSVFAGVIAFLHIIFKGGSFSIVVVLGTLFGALLTGFFFGLVFAVAESKTRENYAEKLAVSDALFGGNFKIRELGELFYWSFVYGGFFFFLPLAAYGAFGLIQKMKLVIPTVNPAEIGGFLPVSLISQSLSPSAVSSFIITTMVFGILACLVCQRFPGKRGSAAVAVVFALLCLQYLKSEPSWLWLALLFSSGLLLCAIWKKYGFPGVLLSIFIPLSLQNVFLLIFAKDMMFAFIGLILLFFWLIVFGISVFLMFKGKPVSKLAAYEPRYLKKLKEKERFERELEIAKNLQSRLLPKNAPDLEFFEIATLCEPANEVGGDYFDFLTINEKSMLIFLGDVSGKGIRAAFYMTLAKGLLHGSFKLVKDHRELLALLNKRFGDLSEEGVFLTLITLTLDFETGDILLSSAGHNPPLLFKKDAVWVVPSRGLVIGPMPEDILLKSLKDFRFKMEAGDVLLLYTDGITEAMNPAYEEYGSDRLKEVFQEAVHLPAAEIVNTIRRSVLEFTEGSPQSDDLTILVLKSKNENR